MIETSVKSLVRKSVQTAVSVCTSNWQPYSRLIPFSDSGKWVIGQEMREVSRLASHLGIKVSSPWLAIHGNEQAIFFGNHFNLLLTDRWFQTKHRLATAYFHGKPGNGVVEFDKCFEMLTRNHSKIARIQVPCKSMREVVLKSGIDPFKIHLIPIGINSTFFTRQTQESRIAARVRFGIPQNAFVIGSFQKDGNGWGEGLEPKMIKGPDVFIETISLLKKRVKNLLVLLSGPARGYVKAGLKKIGVPFLHRHMREYADIGKLYHALDVYIVASREEGGPKSVLESMASGIPLVSTRVGQACDLVVHGVNGFLADIEDANSLSEFAFRIIENENEKQSIIKKASVIAKLHSYEAQLPLWKDFFAGFVEKG